MKCSIQSLLLLESPQTDTNVLIIYLYVLLYVYILYCVLCIHSVLLWFRHFSLCYQRKHSLCKIHNRCCFCNFILANILRSFVTHTQTHTRTRYTECITQCHYHY